MTTSLRKRAREQLERLSPAKVRVAADFLGYLAASKRVSALAKLVKLWSFEEAVAEAERQVSAGKSVPAASLGRKYTRRA
jgi:hypothetical protein